MTFQHHTDQGQNHAGEPDDRQIRGSFGPPTDAQKSDGNGQLDAPGHLGPRLFRVPVHLGATDDLRREGTADDPERQERKPHHN